MSASESFFGRPGAILTLNAGAESAAAESAFLGMESPGTESLAVESFAPRAVSFLETTPCGTGVSAT